MADGKNIEIKIAATGGDQAAAEVRKVDTAVDNLSGGGGAASGKGLKALAEETTKVSAANVRMGTGFQNVGYQVQDLAVQIGSGTSAFRALGQQLPQLLSGFGPLGITLGTVAAVALPLAGAMFNLGNAAEEAGEKADEAADKLEKLADKRADKAAIAAAKELQSFRDALDDETIAYKRQNDEIQRTIDLLQAKRRAQAEVDSADAALALAKIDASDAPEEEKIRARAKVQEDLERKRFEDRKAEAGERVNAAYNRATGAAGDATLARGKEEEERQRLADEQAEAGSLKNRISKADQAAARLPGLDKKITDLSVPTPYVEGEEFQRGEQEAKRLKDLKIAQDERDQAANAAGGASAADRTRLEALKGKDGLGGSVADLEKSIAGLTKAAEALEEAARKAQGDYGATREIETAKLGGDFESTKRRLETNRITSGTAAEKSRRAEAEREAKENFRDYQDFRRAQGKDQAEQQSDEGRYGGSLTQGAFNAAKDARGMGAPSKGVAALEKAAANLSADPGNNARQEATERLLEQVLNWLQNNGKGDTADTAKIRELERKFETLTQQVRNKK